jgi:hypothetical protein
LRILVNISEIGSVETILILLPTTLRYAWNFTTACMFAE